MIWRYVPFLVSGLAVFAPISALSQHSIDVQRAAASGEHLAALATYDRLPRRVVTAEARVAAARSAWALGLPERALAEFDEALHTEGLPAVERARLHLSQGIIHFQEGRYHVALIHAEKASAELSEPSPLRAKVRLLAAESHARLNAFGRAEEFYLSAIAEAAPEDKADIHFMLGECQRPLGKLEAARENFEKVPLRHERTPAAVRHLAEIALETGRFDSAGFWLRRGREEYADRFLDSWTDYALVRVAAHEGASAELREIRARAETTYPPSDGWLTLLVAEAEAYEWRRMNK